MDRVALDCQKESQLIEHRIRFSKDENYEVPVYNTPIPPVENFKLMLDGKIPFWMPSDSDTLSIIPRILPDNVARGYVLEAEPLAPEENGGVDMFGVDWVFVPSVGGSMVKPGNPKLADICDWKKVITFPNLDDYDWEGSAVKNAPILEKNRDKFIETWIFNGLFERLISFLDFEGAALALLDEEQQEAVHELFDRLCILYDDLIGRLQKYYGVHFVTFHDDWGSQRAPFFSLETCREMIAPYLKRVVESCHKRGLYFNFHSCGKNEMLVPAMIEAGIDMWIPQTMNDFDMLVREYGDKLCLGLRLAELPPTATDEEISAAAASYIERSKGCTRVFTSGALFARSNPAMAKLLREIYFQSREAYNKLAAN
ncbi:MAG TPA: methyltransferase [Clostridiales bacterium]|jgi:hypothetical protein|nr:methyltransferase [Clostridiales bacterium]